MGRGERARGAKAKKGACAASDRMVQLTPEEKGMLAGSLGEGVALAMESVVRVAEVLGAPRLVKVSSAHISGVSYKNLGEEGVEFLEELAAKGARFSVPTTVNPAGFDMEVYREMGVGEEEYELQMRIVRALASMGARVTLSCTPYLINPPSFGDHLAWAESNAVLYANSVIGARTNREGGPLSVLEAIVGRAPYVGLHTDEGRAPTVVVDADGVRSFVERTGAVSALGYLLGAKVKAGVPLLVNAPRNLAHPGNLRLFLAAVGAASSIGMVLVEGVSPEFKRVEGLKEIALEEGELERVLDKWSGEAFDAVVLGCPHLSPGELAELASRLGGRRVKGRVLVFTSRWAVSRAADAVEALRRSGVEVYADTCMVVGNLSALGVRRCATDSAKAAFYLSNQGYEVVLAPRDFLLKAVLSSQR